MLDPDNEMHLFSLYIPCINKHLEKWKEHGSTTQSYSRLFKSSAAVDGRDVPGWMEGMFQGGWKGCSRVDGRDVPGWMEGMFQGGWKGCSRVDGRDVPGGWKGCSRVDGRDVDNDNEVIMSMCFFNVKNTSVRR